MPAAIFPPFVSIITGYLRVRITLSCNNKQPADSYYVADRLLVQSSPTNISQTIKYTRANWLIYAAAYLGLRSTQMFNPAVLPDVRPALRAATTYERVLGRCNPTRSCGSPDRCCCMPPTQQGSRPTRKEQMSPSPERSLSTRNPLPLEAGRQQGSCGSARIRSCLTQAPPRVAPAADGETS